MRRLTGLMDTVAPKMTGILTPTFFAKHTRCPIGKYFLKEYKDANTDVDKNLISTVNAMVTSNKSITVMTRDIFKMIVVADQNWYGKENDKRRTFNPDHYKVFIATIEMTGLFQIVHPFTTKAPMIIKLIDPDFRSLMRITPEQEKKMLGDCVAFRAKKLTKEEFDCESRAAFKECNEKQSAHQTSSPEEQKLNINQDKDTFHFGLNITREDNESLHAILGEMPEAFLQELHCAKGNKKNKWPKVFESNALKLSQLSHKEMSLLVSYLVMSCVSQSDNPEMIFNLCIKSYLRRLRKL